MKNLGKVFGFVCASVLLFSCTTDEQDLELQNAIAESQKMEMSTMEEEKEIVQDSCIALVEGTPLVIIIKRD
ncbi:hypothetical protein FLCU109888_02840 [Flavobacterium cucumis]|uniref:Uncharacterized protein n=1 Tax=Flavobacterium cucumis TaxID=416016 RepID=A0A1M7ZUR6_9FLAO|nr:hypothetical protein [Flavobacterium cucumis]SHO72530.1 hypothetical protein SAMN05443547_0864 [Flavobacterium cucumis]